MVLHQKQNFDGYQPQRTLVIDSNESSYDPHKGIKIGNAKNPGPPETVNDRENDDNNDPFILEIGNITNLKKYGHLIADRQFNAFCLTEHSLNEHQVVEAAQIIPGTKIKLSGLDPEHQHQVGGTGIILKGNQHIIKPKPKCNELKELLNKGRCDLFAIEISKGNFCLVYVVYGHTNGDGCQEAAARTCNICETCLRDAELQDSGPVLLVGDLNASIGNIPSVKNVIDEGTYTDIGAIASKFGRMECENTCRATPLCKATRKDYVIANQSALAIIKDFKVEHDTGLPTHSLLKVTFTKEVPRHKYDAVQMPDTIDHYLKIKLKEKFGNLNVEKANTKRNETDMNCKLFQCDYIIPEENESAPKFPAKKKNRKMDSVTKNLIEADENNVAQQEKDWQENIDATNYTNDQTQQVLDDLHGYMDKHLHIHDDKWDLLLRNHDTEFEEDPVDGHQVLPLLPLVFPCCCQLWLLLPWLLEGLLRLHECEDCCSHWCMLPF